MQRLGREKLVNERLDSKNSGVREFYMYRRSLSVKGLVVKESLVEIWL